MSEFNFNKLKNHEIPDSWISGALNVPPEKEKTPFIFRKTPQMIAFAATFVVVCALSVTLFIFTQKGAVLPTSNETQNTIETAIETKTQTEETDDPAANEVETTAPTELAEAAEESVEESHSPNEESNPSIIPSTPSVPSTKPTTPPTESDSSQSDVTEDSENPTLKPSKPSTVPGNSDSILDGNGSSSTVNKIIRCYATITIGQYLADDQIYCALLSQGDMEGGDNRFPENREVTVSFVNGVVRLEYELNNEDGKIKPGEYVYAFYNSVGDVFEMGTVTVH